MKKIGFIVASTVLMIFGGNIMSAQGKYGADSAECIKYLSYYKEYYKSKNFDAALPNWRKHTHSALLLQTRPCLSTVPLS